MSQNIEFCENVFLVNCKLHNCIEIKNDLLIQTRGKFFIKVARTRFLLSFSNVLFFSPVRRLNQFQFSLPCAIFFWWFGWAWRGEGLQSKKNLIFDNTLYSCDIALSLD